MFPADPSACPTTRAAADPEPETSDVNGSGRSRPTMRHVAALAGVGMKTVSRVVNGEPNVSEAMIQRVQEAVQSLDYELDVNAGNLRRLNRRTLTLGLLPGDFANPFSGAVQQGIEQKAWERDAAVLAASFGRDPDRGRAVVRTFTRRRVDGMILAAPAGLTNSVALVGFDDFALSELADPWITVVVQEPERVGRVAAELLFARINGSGGNLRPTLCPRR
jgi:DNA-binding LacI/PurR family transcriptional regulator